MTWPNNSLDNLFYTWLVLGLLSFCFRTLISSAKQNLSTNKPSHFLIYAQQAYLSNKHSKSKLSQFIFPDFPDASILINYLRDSFQLTWARKIFILLMVVVLGNKLKNTCAVWLVP